MKEAPPRWRPHVGMRNLKTALAATLCALLYLPFGRNPTFACIGAIFGVGNDLGHSWLNGGNRLSPPSSAAFWAWACSGST